MKKIELYGGVGYAQLVNAMGDDKSVVNAARVSIGGEATDRERDAKLIRFLAKHKHTSPFEHVVFSFRVRVPLFVARQHMRHRTQSYNEISRRYTAEDMAFWTPDAFRAQASKNLQCSDGFISDRDVEMVAKAWEDSVASSLRAYNVLLEMGVAREQARGVLPQSMMTSYYCTVNMLNLFKFLHLRLDEHAQPEIQELARAMRDLARETAPDSFGAWGL